ncbi:MAG TPA: TonB-dependent receptor [Oleiagrimonas sp.]|nr:TonB-dependent receptor [Oleiagrimonas sp.]
MNDTHHNTRFPLRLGLVLLAVAAPAGAYAQCRVPAKHAADVTGYAPAYFAQAAPVNAWDMVSRVPGFNVVDPDEDVRGYAEARGNVLVDGRRPTSKYQDTKDLLERIPADSVQCIKLIHGDVDNIDMGGYATVVNVVRQHASNHQAAIEAGAVAGTDGWISPKGRFQYGYSKDDRALDVALAFDPELDDDSGRGTVRHLDPDGSVTSLGSLATRTIKNKETATVNWHQPLAGGKLTLNSALRGEQEDTTTDILMHADDDTQHTTEQEDTLAFEAGARYARHLTADSTLKLMATQRLGHVQHAEHSLEDGADEQFDKETRTGESIGRVSLYNDWTGSFSTQTSVEGAYNYLESDARLKQHGMLVDLPGSDVRVEEKRVEVAFKATWQLYRGWTFEAGLRGERSVISHTGDTPITRHFTYLKPRVAVRWDIDPGNQVHLALSREVGQLDFEDFVASASLDTGVVSAGNAELEPETSRRLELGWKHDLWNGGAFTLTWTHDRIDNVVDRVLVITPTDVFDAPGNIGPGRLDTLALDLSFPLDGIGIPGGRIQTSMQWHHSRVTDPTTGMTRSISEEKPVDGQIRFTQDLPAWRLHWGIKLEHIAERKTKYRFDEIEHESEGLGWTAFVERRIGNRWRVRFEATDLFGRDFTDIRNEYDGPRSTRPLDEVKRRNRTTPGFASVTVRYQF